MSDKLRFDFVRFRATERTRVHEAEANKLLYVDPTSSGVEVKFNLGSLGILSALSKNIQDIEPIGGHQVRGSLCRPNGEIEQVSAVFFKRNLIAKLTRSAVLVNVSPIPAELAMPTNT